MYLLHVKFTCIGFSVDGAHNNRIEICHRDDRTIITRWPSNWNVFSKKNHLFIIFLLMTEPNYNQSMGVSYWVSARYVSRYIFCIFSLYLGTMYLYRKSIDRNASPIRYFFTLRCMHFRLLWRGKDLIIRVFTNHGVSDCFPRINRNLFPFVCVQFFCHFLRSRWIWSF